MGVRKGFSFFLAMILCAVAYAQTNIPMSLRTSGGINNLTVVANGDGSFSINTTGNDPSITAVDLTTAYDFNSAYYISFDYISTGGIDDLTIFYGSPFSSDRRVSAGVLAPTTTYKTAVVNLKRTATWNASFTRFRFDFGTTAGQSIQVKNITLRNPTPTEFNSDPIIKDGAGTAFINTYLNTNFPNKINNVQVDANNINLDLSIPSNNGNLFLCEIKMFNPIFSPQDIDFSIPIGNVANLKTSINRFVTLTDTVYDRIYSRWVIAEQNGTSWTYRSNAHFADDVYDASTKYFPEIKPSTKKGIAAAYDAVSGPLLSDLQDDLNNLGSKNVTVNLLMSSNFLSLTPTSLSYNYNGRLFYFNPTFVSNLDATFKSCSDNNSLASIILLIPNNPPTAFKSILTHPDAESSAFYSMANLTTLTGLTYYSAMVSFLADRYNRPDNLYGKISNWIIHNEVDAANTWTSAGYKSLQTYLELYDRSMRTVYYTVRQFDPSAKVFFSSTHFWNGAVDYSPRQMLGALNNLMLKEGDYEWGLAHHPYPQNGSAPWNDINITNDLNTTTLITPKNIELLDTWMRQKTSLYKGLKVRSLMFTEQGVNAGAGTDANTLNTHAAGVAYFWKKFSRLPSLEAVQYHRRVDNATLFPVYFGLWTRDGASTLPQFQGTKKPSWNVWQAAGTATEPSAFSFALPIIGVSSWEQTFNPLFGEVNLCKVDFNLTSQGAAKNDINIYFNGERHTTESAGAATFYNVASLSDTRTYYFKEGSQVIWPSIETTVSADRNINVDLDPVAGFSASRQSPTSIRIDWQDITNFETGYVLESKTVGQSNFTKIADIAANSTSYLNTGLVANENYQYRLYAINDTVKTLYSRVVDADGDLSLTQYTPGNLLVLRVGNGTTLTGNTTAVDLLEYSPAGALINTTTVNNTSGNRLTLSGTSNQEGVLNLSPNGNFVTFAGYVAGVGATDHIGAGSQPKVIALVKNDRTVDLSTKFPKANSTATIRSSATIDGTNFWTVGANGGVMYVPFGNVATVAPTQLTTTQLNIRTVSISNGQLFIGGNTAGVTGIASVGSGTPSTAGQSATNLTNAATMTPVGFAFFNLETAITGTANDVLYVADNTANAIRKFSLVSNTWVENTPSITATNGINGLTGSVVAGKVVLYATIGFTQGINIGNNSVQTLTDESGYNLPISRSLTDLTAPAVAGVNYVFRGISFTPGTAVKTTLPVSLLGFYGKNTTQGIQLNWETASELNNQRFDVLRSTDKDNFQIITAISGKGTTNTQTKYGYLDTQPASGINYYHLNQVDFDGKTTPSKVIAIKTGLAKNELVVNVSENILNLTITSVNTTKANLQIYDGNGRRVVSKDLSLQTGVNSVGIPAHAWAGGVYVVKLAIGTEVLTKKFIK